MISLELEIKLDRKLDVKTLSMPGLSRQVETVRAKISRESDDRAPRGLPGRANHVAEMPNDRRDGELRYPVPRSWESGGKTGSSQDDGAPATTRS